MHHVGDGAHRGDGVDAQVGADEQWLRIGVGDAAHGALARELRQVVLKLGAEGSVLNGVDLTVEAAALPARDHAGAARSEVRVIVNTKENVKCNITMRDSSKERSHNTSDFARLCRTVIPPNRTI